MKICQDYSSSELDSYRFWMISEQYWQPTLTTSEEMTTNESLFSQDHHLSFETVELMRLISKDLDKRE